MFTFHITPKKLHNTAGVVVVALRSLVLAAALSSVLALARGVRGPKGQVVPQELHDQCAVLVTVLVQGVKLCYGVVKCLRDATNQTHSFSLNPFKVSMSPV